ncbi:MAG: NUDIX domain-containing protein [Henriciella sp.]|jgi:8-oxo-dGTP pyrophosphatase MutT (NUDIX family)|nr:NUDIX domain-containing protein [Henriciella sp.]MBO6694847.1 NUDIX domain-containing protein [Henriciella sp.]
MTLGVRGIVEDAHGQVLLVRHTYTKGLFLPGGGVERGETTELSLRRELEEEGGVKVTGNPELLGVFSNHRVFRNDHVLLYRVSSQDWEHCGDPIGREISEIIWCDPRALPDDATPGTQRRLRELLNGDAQSLMW